MHQTIEGDKSSVRWILFDPNEYYAGSGQGSPIRTMGRPPRDSLPFEIDLNVEDPLSPGGTRLEFKIKKSFNGCEPFWVTEQSDPGGKYTEVETCENSGYEYRDLGCDDLRYGLNKWTRTKTGFERYFVCNFMYFGDNPSKPAVRPPVPDPTHAFITPGRTLTDEWRIVFHQEMEGEWSALYWTLYDSNQYEAGRGQGSPINSHNRPKEESLKSPIYVEVKEPTHIDRNNIEFIIGTMFEHLCMPGWTTGQTGEGGDPPRVNDCSLFGSNLQQNDLGCNDVRRRGWKPKNAGFERTFECTLRYPKWRRS